MVETQVVTKFMAESVAALSTVVAAPHLSRLVEDLSATLTLGLLPPPQPCNACVSTSPCSVVFTSVPGKSVVEVEEEV